MGFPLSAGKMDQEMATSLVWKSYPILVRLKSRKLAEHQR